MNVAKSLNDMTKTELIEMAKEMGLDADLTMLKADIVKLIEEYPVTMVDVASQPAEEDPQPILPEATVAASPVAVKSKVTVLDLINASDCPLSVQDVADHLSIHINDARAQLDELRKQRKITFQKRKQKLLYSKL